MDCLQDVPYVELHRLQVPSIRGLSAVGDHCFYGAEETALLSIQVGNILPGETLDDEVFQSGALSKCKCNSVQHG
jgi:hypothetical protein